MPGPSLHLHTYQMYYPRLANCRPTEGEYANEYANAKREVDAIRAELGQAPLPTLQNTIDEKTSQ